MQSNEVHEFGEAIDNGENNILLVDLGEALDEIHRYVCPHVERHVEWMKKIDRLQGQCVVVLTCDIGINEVTDKHSFVRDIEVIV